MGDIQRLSQLLCWTVCSLILFTFAGFAARQRFAAVSFCSVRDKRKPLLSTVQFLILPVVSPHKFHASYPKTESKEFEKTVVDRPCAFRIETNFSKAPDFFSVFFMLFLCHPKFLRKIRVILFASGFNLN